MSQTKLTKFTDTFADTKFLTGLRCFAALAVFFIHAGGAGLRGSPFANDFFNRFVDFGKFGVIVFFVLSAVTISISLDASPKFKFTDYLVKRFFRIAPLYYFIIAIAFLFGGVGHYFEIFSVENDFDNLLMHVSFLNLFNPRYRNNLLGVEWTIPLEMFYYLILPLGHFCLTRYQKIGSHLFIISLSISLACSFLFTRFYDPKFVAYIVHWSIEKYVFSYAVGLLLYKYLLRSRSKTQPVSSWLLLEMAILLVIFIRGHVNHEEEFIALWTAGLIWILSLRPFLGNIIFENKIVMYLGKISYSIYLVHYPILTFVKNYYDDPLAIFCTGLLLTIALSSTTYFLIEAPFMKLGKHLGRRSADLA